MAKGDSNSNPSPTTGSQSWQPQNMEAGGSYSGSGNGMSIGQRFTPQFAQQKPNFMGGGRFGDSSSNNNQFNMGMNNNNNTGYGRMNNPGMGQNQGLMGMIMQMIGNQKNQGFNNTLIGPGNGSFAPKGPYANQILTPYNQSSYGPMGRNQGGPHSPINPYQDTLPGWENSSGPPISFMDAVRTNRNPTSSAGPAGIMRFNSDMNQHPGMSPNGWGGWAPTAQMDELYRNGGMT